MWSGLEQNSNKRKRKKTLLSIMAPKFISLPDNDSDAEETIPELNSELILACSEGHFDTADRLLDCQRNSALAQDSNGWTCLHHAAANNKIKIIDLLLFKNANIDAQDNNGNTALHIACENGIANTVEHLLMRGADGSIWNKKEFAPLHVATMSNHPHIIEELAKHHEKIDFNQRGKQGGTALHIAAIMDYPECAAELIKGGCKMCISCDRGLYPLVIAARHASSLTMEVLLRRGESVGYTREKLLSFVDCDLNTPLHAAVNSGDLEAVRVCLEHGARIDMRQSDQATAFHLACSQGTLSIVQLMYRTHITMFPDVGHNILTDRDVLEMTPLHKAAMFEHADVVKFLIDKGSDINCEDVEGRSPLMLAAVRCGLRSFNTLLSAGAKVTVRDSCKRNVLHFLVSYGASLGDELKSICMAEEGPELLNQKDVTGLTPLHLASQLGSLRLLDSLLSLGANVNAKDNDEQSPLHFAASSGRINTVRRLLASAQGPNIINESNGIGMTALHLASMNGHVKVVQELLYRGALLHKDFQGRTPLHLAAEGCYTQTMKLLLSFHANLLDQADKKGDTAMHYAAYANKAPALELLMTAGGSYTDNNAQRSPLDICTERRHVEGATALVGHDRWDEFLHRHSTLYGCPLLGLIRHLPEVHRIVLDRCRTSAKVDPSSKDYWEKYRFDYLQAPIAKVKELQKEKSEIVPLLTLNHMVKHGRVNLLSHPVCTTFLQMKWKTCGFWFYAMHMTCYLLFLSSLTLIVARLNPTFHSCNAINGSMTSPNTSDLVTANDWCFYLLIFIFTFAIVNMVKELYQIYEQRICYFRDLTNYTEWALYVTTAIFVAPILFTPTHCVSSIQWQCAAMAIFLAWFNFLLYMSCSQAMGLYIVMFTQILNTVVRVIIAFSVLFIAFGLTFHVLLFRNNSADSYGPVISILHSVLMMMGEVEFGDKYAQPYIDHELQFPLLNFIFLIVFIVLMPILLINLLIGLAVGDIEMISNSALLKRLAMQVDYQTELEQRLPAWLIEYVDRNELTVYPNQICEHLGLFRSSGQYFKKLFGMNELAEPTEQETAPVASSTTETNSNEIMDELWRSKKRMKELQSQLDNQNKLLRLIVQKMEISAEANDFDEGGGVHKNTFSLDGGTPGVAPSNGSRATGKVRTSIESVMAFKKGLKKTDK